MPADAPESATMPPDLPLLEQSTRVTALPQCDKYTLNEENDDVVHAPRFPATHSRPDGRVTRRMGATHHTQTAFAPFLSTITPPTHTLNPSSPELDPATGAGPAPACLPTARGQTISMASP